MRSYWIRAGSKSHKTVLVRDKKGHTDVQGRSHIETEAEIRVTLPQTKEYQETPEARRGKNKFSFRDSRGILSLPMPYF